MHRCGSGFLLTLAITLVAAFTGCLGKSSTTPGSGGVQRVSLNPSSNFSLETGGTLGFSASATDAAGHTVLGVAVQFIVVSGIPNTSAPLSVASSGSACAGTWDPTVSLCSPGNSGIALVTAVANGVSSPVTTVYVHQHIDSIQISRLIPPGPPQQLYDCFPQGQTWEFGATARSNNVDITNTVGPISWSSSNSGVVTVTPFVPPAQPNVLNQVQTTAKSPGIAQLIANVSGFTFSAPYPFTTCLIQSISLEIGGQGQAGNSITVNNGGSVSIKATVFDTLHQVANTPALTNPPLTWSTTNPEVAAFGTTTNSTGSNSASARANLGGATITASCTPPTCNIGVLPGLPIYASDGALPNGIGFGAISVNVTSTSKPPTYTGWAATTGCQDQVGCSSALFPVTPGTTPIGSIISLPRTPNSMMFNHALASRLYIGSDVGLMFVDVTGPNPNVTLISNSTTPCNVSLCGKVLATSNDGKLVVVSDRFSVPRQVYIFDGSSTSSAPIDLIMPGETATAAAFSPDQLKLFILTDTGKIFVHSTVDALAPVQLAAPATDVKFSADGSFAYVAGTPTAGSVSGFATCNAQSTHASAQISPAFDSVTTPGIPLQIFPSPDGQHVLTLDPANGGIDIFATIDEQIPLADGQFVCNAPTVNFPQTAQSFDLGQGRNFTPVYAQLVNNGNEMIVVARKIHAVLVFNVSNGQTSSIPLGRAGFGDTDPLSASASTDGSQVYVAACDQYDQTTTPPTCAAGSVHMVNTCGALGCTVPPSFPLGDFQQVPYVNINDVNNPNMCNNQGTGAQLCLPDLIAIRPQ